MNQAYNVVWNASQGTWQAVSELAKRQGPRSVSVGTTTRAAASVWRPALSALSLAVSALTIMTPTGAYAVTPVGETYTTGDATVDSNTTVSGTSTGIETNGSIGALTNNGTITGALYAIKNDAGSSIASLVNAGTLSGNYGVYSSGTIGAIDNQSIITANNNSGIYNVLGSITTIENEAGAQINAHNTGIRNTGTIDTITNAGTINGT
ncbi:MAG: ESPR domain-containing protein, partial [Paraburkholderia tropica]